MADIKVGDTVYIRNQGYRDGKVTEIRASDDPAPTLVAVRFGDGKADWLSEHECLPESPLLPRAAAPIEPSPAKPSRHAP